MSRLGWSVSFPEFTSPSRCASILGNYTASNLFNYSASILGNYNS